MPYKDPEKQKEAVRKSYKKHRKKRLAYSKKRNAIPKIKKKRNEYGKKYYKENIVQVRAKRKTYQQEHREEDRAHGKKYYKENKKSVLLRQKKYRKKNQALINSRTKGGRHQDKFLVFTVYTRRISRQIKPCCAICNENKDLIYLSIDHIRGRKVVGHSRNFGGKDLYKFLIEKNFPKGYRVLCFNCNYLEGLKLNKRKLVNSEKNIYERKRRLKIKLEVLKHYSDNKLMCSCCGIGNDVLLTIDHVEGRKKFKHDKSRRGQFLYSWLKRNNYPKGFDVLCFNCNFASGNLGFCPHKV